MLVRHLKPGDGEINGLTRVSCSIKKKSKAGIDLDYKDVVPISGREKLVAASE